MSRPLGDWVLIVLLSVLGAIALDHVRHPAPATTIHWEDLPDGAPMVPGKVYHGAPGWTVEMLPDDAVCAPPQPHHGGPI